MKRSRPRAIAHSAAKISSREGMGDKCSSKAHRCLPGRRPTAAGDRNSLPGIPGGTGGPSRSSPIRRHHSIALSQIGAHMLTRPRGASGAVKEEGHLFAAAGLPTAPAAASASRRSGGATRILAASRCGDELGAEPPFVDVERELDRFLEALRGLIEARGLSQAAIAAQLGWRRRHVRQLLNRRRPLEYHDLVAILDVIGVEPRDFFALMASPETEN